MAFLRHLILQPNLSCKPWRVQEFQSDKKCLSLKQDTLSKVNFDQLLESVSFFFLGDEIFFPTNASMSDLTGETN